MSKKLYNDEISGGNIRILTHFIAMHDNCSNLQIQDIEEGIARLERDHSGSEIPVVSSEIFIYAEKR